MKRLKVDLNSLSVQMILSFMGLALLTAVAAGLPAIWLIRDQLERQAWAQVEQGSRAAEALYEVRQRETTSLATLMAQRPTLCELLTHQDQAEWAAYLHTLQVGVGLDLVLVCDRKLHLVAQAGKAIPKTLCADDIPTGFHIVRAGSASQVWLLAAHPISDESGNQLGTVVVGDAVDDTFAERMHTQTGLENTVLIDEQPVATSLGGGVTSRQSAAELVFDGTERGTFGLDGYPYYAARFPLSTLMQEEAGMGSSLAVEVALAVTNIVAAQQRLVRTVVGSTLVVAALGSLLGTGLARQISQPLARLAEAAASLSKGNSGSPLGIEAHVREVALVAQALEGARVDLQHTLHALRQETAWIDHLLEAIVEGIVTLDSRGHITFFSHGAERITGWTRDEVMGRSCDRVFQPVETDQVFTELIPAPGRRVKIPVELRDGRQAVLAVTGARLLPPKSGDARVALVFRDISEEEAIHRLLGHFMANVSHEFRTPLSALAASVELLIDQALDLSVDELQELLASLHLGVLGLQTVVDNLLESASLETGHFRISPRPFNLSEIIAEAVRMMQPLLAKHDQHLTVDLPASIPAVNADPRRTTQVLINLLSNASKYGPDEAEIAVGAALLGDWVRVAVADQGPGIPAEYRDTLFRRFMQLESTNNRAQYGVGLGLSVVKAIVEAHGGQVGIEDRQGGGSVFWFILPVARER